jgi:hypothetical protein
VAAASAKLHANPLAKQAAALLTKLAKTTRENNYNA